MLTIIPSKSYAHRAYICDFLAGGDGKDVICDLDSDDIKATRSCLQRIMLRIRNAYGPTLRLDAGESGSTLSLDCGESGSTLRFMLPLVGALGLSVEFITKGRLSERPLGELESELEKHGMTIRHLDGDVISASGKLSSGEFLLPGSVSSQYITGLLLALPYLDGDSSIMLTSALQSAAYVDITIDVLKEYGVAIEELKEDGARTGELKEDEEGPAVTGKSGYLIRGRQKYYRSSPYAVEGDWSQAAFWLAAGTIGSKPVSISGLNMNSVQGDRKIVDVLRSFGADIRVGEDGDAEGAENKATGETADNRTVITANPSELTGITVDASEIPDLAPAIACVAAAASGETRLIHAERLRLKESDRIKSIVRCLTDLGIKAEGTDSEIVIQGCGITQGDAQTAAQAHGGVVAGTDAPADGTAETAEADVPAGGTAETAGDHRIVMMAAVLSLITENKVAIMNSGAVSKSYPTFFEELERLGFADNVVLEHQ